MCRAEVRTLSHEGTEIFSLPFVGVTSLLPIPPFVLGHSTDYERRCILGPSFRRALTGSPTMSISLKRTNLPERLFRYEDHHQPFRWASTLIITLKARISSCPTFRIRHTFRRKGLSGLPVPGRLVQRPVYGKVEVGVNAGSRAMQVAGDDLHLKGRGGSQLSDKR